MLPDTKIPENCPAWLAQWIGKSDTRLGNIEKTLGKLWERGSKKNNPEPSEPKADDSDKVTFKWLVEKLAVPAMFMAAGYIAARGGG